MNRETESDRTTLNICEAPYNADPTGRSDCTRAILQALNNITDRTRIAFRQTMEEMEKLPTEGCHYHPNSFENRRVDGVIYCVTSIFLRARILYQIRSVIDTRTCSTPTVHK